MKLRPVTIKDAKILYDLLKERTGKINFSDNTLPTLEEHKRFIKSKPYQKWYIIEENNSSIGSINLDKQDGIGTFIFRKFQGMGYGTMAVNEIIKLNPRIKYYANIHPENIKSIKLYTKCGFKPKYIHFTRGQS